MHSIVQLWQQSDIVIKCVAMMLFTMSILSWYVIALRVAGALKFRQYRQQAIRFHAEHGQAHISPNRHNPFFVIDYKLTTAMDQYRQSTHALIGVEAWLNESLRGAIDYANERHQQGLTLLSSIASTAPFVGLFGTVWGIYHALGAMAATGQASIDKVAGPVGEALIMTAFGLAVAIPAALAYNAVVRFNRRADDAFNHYARQLYGVYMLDSRLSQPESARAKEL